MRQVQRFDAGWLFHLGDVPSPLPNTHIAAYMNHKAGWAGGAARRNFDDSDWQSVHLPHDWSIEGPFDPANHMDAGFLPRGVGWYRRYFRLDESDRGRRVSIRFDGVATHSRVYVNGHLLHRHFSGYTPFTVDMTDVASFGPALNVVAVRVDATYMEGWWYEGAGIYRHVWLIRTEPLHIGEFGVFVRPALKQKDSGQVSQAAREVWETVVDTTICNDSFTPQAGRLRSTLLSPEGTEAGSVETPFEVAARCSVELSHSIQIQNPQRWSLEAPQLYRIRSEILHDGVVIDQELTTFGYRTFRFDPQDGFFLNEQPLKLLGTCNHQDHGGLGVALPDSIHEFRIRRLKEMGCNAYRCAHHPPASELLDACDRLGMLVMDENRTFGSSPEALEQLRTMVRRDRNHPCVILWSICNEEAIQTSPVSGAIARAMVHAVREAENQFRSSGQPRDPAQQATAFESRTGETARPVTAAVSGGILNDGCIGDALDVMSINYQLPLHDAFHAKRPRVPLIAAETHCVISTRGIWQTDLAAGRFACDDHHTHPWGQTARNTWRFVRERRFISGLFAWSGFDYRGEPAPGRWPITCSQLGMMDLCGFPKDLFYLHKAWWTQEPFVHLSPHWTWPGREGQEIRVLAYTNCEEVELWLNDRSLGRKPVDPIEMAVWQVIYEPGTLRACGFRAGGLVAESTFHTAGAATRLDLVVDPTFLRFQKASTLRRSTAEGDAPGSESVDDPIHCDIRDAVPLTVCARDGAGRIVPTAEPLITMHLSGPGRVLGIANGDPASLVPGNSRACPLFGGLAQVIVQGAGEPGRVLVSATAEGLQPAQCVIAFVPGIAPRGSFSSVPVEKRRFFLTEWRRSPVYHTRPDIHQTIADADMNTWEQMTIDGRQTPTWPSAGFAIYRTTFTVPKFLQASGGRLEFRQAPGILAVSLGGKELAIDRTGDTAVVRFGPSTQKQELSVLVYSAVPAGGFCGPVELLRIE
ncbi:MAG: DUF4982 domain-containing protein [Phycisphaerae bacterium]|nr:DUF4982 domain-containing protein [Phycisphaerae bacterium]MDW8262667.1 glycoside hydrolase family 2 TIM barrel-domain containing protein [Phycisphaerales bacterium]